MQLFLNGTGITLLYILTVAGGMLLARKCLTIPNELFRKILHFILLGAYIPLVFAFEMWWMAAAFASALMVICFPVLMLAEKLPMFSSFMTERKKGELKNSMVLALGVMVVSISVCWGWFGDRWLVLACVYAWGVGDAFAALVGKRFGRHKIKWKMADSKKSMEGSFAMFVSAFISVTVVLYLRGGMPLAACFGIAAAAAAVCTLTEMSAKNGMDTFVCPLSAMAVILPLVYASSMLIG